MKTFYWIIAFITYLLSIPLTPHAMAWIMAKERSNKIRDILVVVLLLIAFQTVNCQTVNCKLPAVTGYDTVIVTEAYTSYFSYHYHNPVVVTYHLYQGGGDCSRAAFRFKNDIPGLPCAKQKDYDRSGYDEGHLCDAADMAGNCKLDESTFRFYNCVPQTPNLNRGIWKHWETEIRKESQTDSLYIEAGSVFSNEFIGDSVYVPALCYKLVGSLATGKILHCILCTNSAEDAECKDVDYEVLLESLNK
jgi:endonuclease G, mitochondrial